MHCSVSLYVALHHPLHQFLTALTEPELKSLTQDAWKDVASAYHRWATDSIVVHRKKRLSHDSASQVISSVHRLLKDRARAMGLPAHLLAPLSVAEDVNEVAAWIRGQATTPGYLSKQVSISG